jgi:hypothetical protein
MEEELSIPGFGWASPASPAKKVWLSEEGFAFSNDEANRANLAILVPTLPIYDDVLLNLKKGVCPTDFEEATGTGKSHGRQLRFDLMSILPNLSFSLHAHPNVEAIYVVKGAIHEYRYQGEDLGREVYQNDGLKPRLAAKAEQFTRQHVAEGGWIINRPGSVHLSFTCSEGAELLVLWSGSHFALDGADEPLTLPDQVLPL